jgi:alpha-1,3-fucosyltransferase
MWSNWDPSLSDQILINARCSVTSCLFTPDVTMLNQSDVVVIYIDTSTNFPLNRQPNQRFVFFNLEPPHYSSLAKLSDQRVRYGYFNWTMTYRWDSDIIHRSDYGFFVKKSNEVKHITKSKNKSVKTLIKGKTKLVAWFVSNCITPVRRENYVQQLSKYIPVDIFGSCTMQNCSTKCYDMLHNDYKFYLAFENTWCPDYVTEKFYRSLKYNTVPIVMGGAEYERFAPPNSYINVKDFRSPKELAEYILMLHNSDELYAKYFNWKKYYSIAMPYNYGLCELCRMAHDETLPPKIYWDIKEWWFDSVKCLNTSN